jgi:hypothetical protein
LLGLKEQRIATTAGKHSFCISFCSELVLKASMLQLIDVRPRARRRTKLQDLSNINVRRIETPLN